MFLKYAAIAAIVFALLAFGFSRWKKKSRHTYSLKTGGNPAPKTGRGRHEAGYFNLPKPDRQHVSRVQKEGFRNNTSNKTTATSRSRTKGKRK